MTTTAPITYACTRCSGTGRLDVFSHVLGGTCFKCGGTGKQSAKPAAPSLRWQVFGTARATGCEAHLYNERARTAAEAVRKARKTFTRASTDYRAEFSLDDATARPMPTTEAAP